ncbi:DUF3489 domain-containing protein [Pseudahrensia aquimaris]|uniref:DUF3489 domain-containing protein n=1 Tax=Pseudahrensia aquimaris TaxID=744461 RepID=A0ABW3FDJ7_9HYPH
MTKTSDNKQASAAAKAERLTKKAQLVTLLQRKSGMTIAEASAKFGWQQHTTRAALTGLRKAGYSIELTKTGNGSAGTYCATAGPAEAVR